MVIPYFLLTKGLVKVEFFTQLTIMQWLGAGFGVTQVLLARNNNIHNYLFGIISILISIWVLYQSVLYADIVLHLYYLVMSVYGWFFWKMGKQKQETPISYANAATHRIAIGIVVGCFALMAFWLDKFTNSDVPYWDAIVSAFAWAGMWLMAKRKIENWIYLNISNLLMFPLLIFKGLYIYAGLTVFLFLVAISGYINWKNILTTDTERSHVQT